MNKTIYLFEDGFDADFDAAPVAKVADPDAIKQRTHVANGGEGTETFACPACRGRGRFISYAGRVVGDCFKCRGAGKVGKRVMAAAKGKETRAANVTQWHEDHKAEIAYVCKRANKGSIFYASFVEKMEAYGTLTENQMVAVHRDMAKDAAFWEAKKAEQAAAAPVIQMSAIEALFAKAVDNDVKRPVFRADGLEISKAPVTGRNAGALYVKAGGEYAGKIVDGKFHKVFNAPADTADRLMAVAADPLAEAMKYGRRTGNCALCGRDLVDPISIRALVGPVCAPRWGLDWKREAAAEELAEEAAKELATKEGGQ